MKIPQEVKSIIEELRENDFEAYIVGGCVRDLLLGIEPKDWDITTNAKPEEIQKIFPDSFYENKFGTVAIKATRRLTRTKTRNYAEEDSQSESVLSQRKSALDIVEVTTYRVESKYTDKRHPDEVRFADKLEDDLKRRDFTVNALALKIQKQTSPPPPLNQTGSSAACNFFEIKKGGKKGGVEIIDLFSGQEDLKNKIIRAVGDADERFNEDALRMLRAVRFAVELSSTNSRAQRGVELDFPAKGGSAYGWQIEPETFKAIQKNAGWLEAIAKERIRDEFEKIIMSAMPEKGIELLRETGLLKYIIPELEIGIGVAQDRHHIYSVYEHNLMSLKFAGQKKYNLIVRLAALLHDIGKPQTKVMREGVATFYNHEVVSAKMAVRILDRLRFPKEIIERVANLIRYHMFVYDVGVVTPAAVRRLLVKVGPENMEDLIAVRVADRLGSGVPKAQPYRLRHFQYMVEKVQHDPISVKMLKVNGNEIMEILKIESGPIIGAILDVLLAEVIEKPEKNEKEYLEKRIVELSKIELVALRKMAKEFIKERREEEDKKIKSKFWVK